MNGGMNLRVGQSRVKTDAWLSMAFNFNTPPEHLVVVEERGVEKGRQGELEEDLKGPVCCWGTNGNTNKGGENMISTRAHALSTFRMSAQPLHALRLSVQPSLSAKRQPFAFG